MNRVTSDTFVELLWFDVYLVNQFFFTPDQGQWDNMNIVLFSQFFGKVIGAIRNDRNLMVFWHMD